MTTIFAQWSTNGSSIIHTDDKVGINTNDPKEDLDVHGGIRITDNTPSLNFYGFENNVLKQKFLVYVNSSPQVNFSFFSNTLNFRTTHNNISSTKMKLLPSGEFSIGTTSTAQKLNIGGAIKLGYTTTNSSGSIRYNGTNFQGYTSGVWKNLDEENIWNLNGNNVFFTAGKVGIKTNNPSTDLDVHGSGIIRASNSSPRIQLYDNASGINRITAELRERANIVYLESLRGDLFLRTGLNGSAASRVIIKGSDGDVGIGTVKPDQKLDVIGAIKIGNTTTNVNGSIRYDGNNFQGYTGGSWVNLNGAGGTGGSVWSLNGSEAYYSNGNVGIGTNNPTHLLHVAGDLAVAGSIVAPSDRRLKQDITAIDDALNIVNQLQPKSYTYIDAQAQEHGLSQELQYGLIAQELEAVLPTLVSDTAVMGKDGIAYKGIEYAQLIPILTQAIKELSEENKVLKVKYQDQTSIILSFAERLAKLEATQTDNYDIRTSTSTRQD